MEAEFGVPAANMADTLRTFNATTDPIGELDPPRRRDHAPIAEAPLHAIACVSGITYTMGGLQVDADMRVAAECSTACSPRAPTPATSSRTSTAAGWAGRPSPAAARARRRRAREEANVAVANRD